jgi:hypothetical protein
MSYAIEFLSKLVLVYSRDRFCVFSGTDASHSRRHSTLGALGDQTKKSGIRRGEICGGEIGEMAKKSGEIQRAMGTCGEIQRATDKECEGIGGIDAVLPQAVLPRVVAACDEPAHAAANAHSAASHANSQDPDSDPDDRDKTEVVFLFFFQMPRTCAIW